MGGEQVRMDTSEDTVLLELEAEVEIEATTTVAVPAAVVVVVVVERKCPSTGYGGSVPPGQIAFGGHESHETPVLPSGV